MFPLRHASAAAALLLVAAGCGDRDTTNGFADPCLTPMAGVLGCPASSGHPGKVFSAADACRKLVTCGTLAATNTRVLSSMKPCNTDSDCSATAGEECKKASDGRLWCHTPVLDQRWCYLRLTRGGADPCDKTQSFSAQQIGNALQCMADTACEVLGLPFSEKVLPMDKRPQLDLYTCEKKKTYIWTATACDHGLLHY